MNALASYTETQKVGQDDLVLQHASLVKRLAYHMAGRMPPSVQVEDLMQAGMIGLLEASRNYDPTQGASFETYASIRVRGSMLDEIRKSDWTPRSVHRKARMVADAVHEVENREGRDAKDSEVAELLEISLDDYYQILKDSSSARIFSVEDVLETAEEQQGKGNLTTPAGPLEGLEREGFKRALADTISGLSERERLVLALYYDEELNLREIGEVLGVSESRVCQIHSQAMARLRARMTDWAADRD